MLLSKCEVCDRKKLEFIKDKKANGLLSNLIIGIKTPLSNLYDRVYGVFKYLNRRTASDKTLCDKAFNIAKYDGYQRRLTSMVYKRFDKKSSGGAIQNENISNKELAEELHKPIIRNS